LCYNRTERNTVVDQKKEYEKEGKSICQAEKDLSFSSIEIPIIHLHAHHHIEYNQASEGESEKERKKGK